MNELVWGHVLCCRKGKHLKERFCLSSELFVTSKFLLLCTRRHEAMYLGWVVKTDRGSGAGGNGGVNSRRGERGEENINRACGAEAACHGPLQEKD